VKIEQKHPQSLRSQWARQDSNLRRQSHQIYSLTRLSTSVHALSRASFRLAPIQERKLLQTRRAFSTPIAAYPIGPVICHSPQILYNTACTSGLKIHRL
jgi:hypothetical protein